MVLSGHYHNAKTRIDTFTNADGSTRKVYNMLFDYQGLMEGGAGYIRLMHFDVEGQRMIVRTFTLLTVDQILAIMEITMQNHQKHQIPGK